MLAGSDYRLQVGSQLPVHRSAGQVLDKRFSSRYQFTVSYAFSRYTVFNGVINNDNLNESYGIAGSNRPHRFTFSGIWNIPGYGGGNAIAPGDLRTDGNYCLRFIRW